MKSQKKTGNLTPLRIAVIYAVLGSLWILISDIILSRIYPAGIFTYLSILKGLLYVLVTSLILYGLTRSYTSARESAEETLRESEERFRTIFNSASEAIVVYDLETGAFADVNARMCELFGYSRDQLLKLDAGALSSGEPIYARAEALGWIRKTIEAGRQIFEWHCRDKAGRLFWVEVNMSQADIGKKESVLITLRDISERRRIIEAEIAKEAAEAASKAKSDFLANMSHELRTPLNSIIGFSEIMRDGSAGEINERQREFADQIYNSGKHLLSLINDVLDLSKIEAGKMELNCTSFAIRDLINSCLNLFEEETPNHNLRLAAEIEEGLEIIYADPRLIKQVLLNLVNNAVKFTPDGGSVSLKVRNAGPDLIEFSVADTGIGISPADQQKLFEPFRQLDTSYNRKYAGTGLGLSICKKIVELHDGRIWLESEPGKGSKFTFFIHCVNNEKDKQEI